MTPYKYGLMPPTYDLVTPNYRAIAECVVAAILTDPYNGHRVYDTVSENLYYLGRVDVTSILLVGYIVDLSPGTVDFPFIGTLIYDPNVNYFDMHFQVRRLLQKVSLHVGLQVLD